ncbi:unnamed protein product [Prunus armeniaca]
MGLSFRNLPFILIATNEYCSLKKKYFCNNKVVILSKLEQAFNDCIDEEDVIKLGFLYFVVFVLLDYHQVKVPKKTTKTKTSKKKSKTTVSGRPREYHIKGFGFALQIWAFEVFPALAIWAFEVFPALAALHFVVHEEYGTSPVDVQLLWPTLVEKQQPYWTWGNNDENNE